MTPDAPGPSVPGARRPRGPRGRLARGQSPRPARALAVPLPSLQDHAAHSG
jgi:hypothetical protein